MKDVTARVVKVSEFQAFDVARDGNFALRELVAAFVQPLQIVQVVDHHPIRLPLALSAPASNRAGVTCSTPRARASAARLF